MRRQHLLPRLAGARALGAEQLGEAALLARWRLGDGSTLRIACNFGSAGVRLPTQAAATLIHESLAGAHRQLAREGLPAACTVVELLPADE